MPILRILLAAEQHHLTGQRMRGNGVLPPFPRALLATIQGSLVQVLRLEVRQGEPVETVMYSISTNLKVLFFFFTGANEYSLAGGARQRSDHSRHYPVIGILIAGRDGAY